MIKAVLASALLLGGCAHAPPEKVQVTPTKVQVTPGTLSARPPAEAFKKRWLSNFFRERAMNDAGK